MGRSLVDIMAGFDPKHRLAQRKQLVYEQMENAKLALQQNHHEQMMAMQQQRLQHDQDRLAQTERLNQQAFQEARDREIIAGENARQLSRQEFLQNQLAENTKLIHSFYDAHSNRRRDWRNKVAETQKSLYEIEADTIRQKALSKQQHKQEMEKMLLAHKLQSRESHQNYRQNKKLERSRVRQQKSLEKQQQYQKLEAMVLDYNLRVLEKNLDSLLQDKRVTYDGLNEILMRVISRFLGLGEHQLNDWEMEQYIKEAMKQI